MDATQPRPVILLVNNDPAIGDLTTTLLQAAGYRVVTAATQAEALTALTAVRFHLILTETAAVPTAAVSPWASLAPLRQAAGDTPVVIFTAYPPCWFADYAAHGFAGLLTQPFDLDAFLAQVQALLQVA